MKQNIAEGFGDSPPYVLSLILLSRRVAFI
jgi:hypothetical protein